MCNRKKTILRSVPAYILSGGLITGALMKITGVHPMAPHFAEMGLQPYLTALGCVEIVCVSFFLFQRTIKAGLLLLTAYFAGAMAAEIPYHMMAVPAMVLALVWIAAFVRRPGLFRDNHLTTAKS